MADTTTPTEKAPTDPTAAAADAAAADAVPTAVSEKKKHPKFTFMLHDSSDMSSLGKYVSTDYRYAALKVASRGHTRILLRKTNSREIREFVGEVVTLDVPKEIHRGDRVIKYFKKPTVKFVKRWVYSGAVVETETVPAETVA